MLEKIDQIPWATLTHAYGPATDVPDLLRCLLSADSQECSTAFNELYGNLWHQGTVYNASAHAVPFFIELLQAPDVICKPDILRYLQALATGSSYLNAHAEMYGPKKKETDAFQKSMAEELRWVQAAHDAVVSGFDVYVDLLDHDDVRIRREVPVVLTACVERLTDIVKLLNAHLEHETDALARASAVFALSYIARSSPDLVLHHLQLIFDRTDEPTIVRVTASFGILENKDKEFDTLFDFLVSTLPDIDEEVNELSLAIVCGRGDGLIPEVSDCLSRNPTAQSQWLQRLLLNEDAQVREIALWEIEEACRLHRSTTVALLPAVAQRLKDPEHAVQDRAAKVMATLGKNALAAATAVLPPNHRLVKQIEEKSQELRNDHTLEYWLAYEAKRPSISGATQDLLVRIEELSDSGTYADRDELAAIVTTLATRHDETESIVPVLAKLLRHDDQWVRVATIRTLWKLTHDADLILPALRQDLNCSPSGLLVLDCLGQMGRAATSFIPILQGMIDQDERLPASGFSDSWIAEDECFVEAVEQTLKRIKT